MTRPVATDRVPVAPSLAPTLERAHVAPRLGVIDRRVAMIVGLAVAVGILAAGVAVFLTGMIGAITHLVFYGTWSTALISPAGNHLGWLVVLIPVAGGLVVGVMARYGSAAIRGHGIPEAMEQVLLNQSRIPLRMTFLKPLSAAIAIGTGGPFGAEGPIIATGGALGSMLGQFVRVTPDERKTLLAAGAAAGMAATFGTAVAAVLLAIELLLFEYRPRSMVPVAFAAVAATAVRYAIVGTAPAFAMSGFAPPDGAALAVYAGLGALIGVAAVGVTRLVYAVEDGFEHHVRIHWMWWPAIGGLVVGLVGVAVPHTLGVGYDNLDGMLTGAFAWRALAVLGGAKLVSWSLSLGSGTSGGTLAPLFTIGGTLGALGATAAAALWPGAAIDPRVGALVGMAAMFAGASRALLASVVFAFETTRQPMALLPLLAGGTAAYFVSCLLMPTTIMTEKLARRGVRVASEYGTDVLDEVHVDDYATDQVSTLDGALTIEAARARLGAGDDAHRHGFPVIDGGALIGVVTRRDLFDAATAPATPVRALVKRPPVVCHPDHTLHQAVELMLGASVGRLVVVERDAPAQVAGILTRSDVLAAHERRLASGKLGGRRSLRTRQWT